jgi:hypothetical protein
MLKNPMMNRKNFTILSNNTKYFPYIRLSDDAKASSRKDKKAVIQRRISKKKYIEIVDNSNDSDSDDVAASKRVETHDRQADDEPAMSKVLFKGKKAEILSEEQINEEPNAPSKGKVNVLSCRKLEGY